MNNYSEVMLSYTRGSVASTLNKTLLGGSWEGKEDHQKETGVDLIIR